MRRLRSLCLYLLCVTVLLAGSGFLATGTAAAAVPNRWGFAYVNIPSGIPDPSHQAGSWPAGFNVTVSPGVPGETFVRFPQIAGPGGVVHVTAVIDAAVWCQAGKWWPSGPDEIVSVKCYKFGGSPAAVPFSIVYNESTGLLPAPQGFGYVHYMPGSIVTQFNSAGGINTVVPIAVNAWRVVLPGLGTPGPEGGVQVTAADPQQPARCKVRAWPAAPVVAGAQTVEVVCHDALNGPLKTGWSLTYQRRRAIYGAAIPPKLFAYTFDNVPANPGPYAPVPAGINFNSVGAVNTVQTAGTGLRLVTFPKVGTLPDNVQVTAYGPGPEYCNLLTVWTTSASMAYVRDVACYTAVTRLDTASLVTYASFW
ncbi:hypothetical protein [Nonomuraea sediminis]|uniref:hypothetical protein n=1 Tax=Nonomuraea sediminis TaxID=2835864 RepID=UPI001BDC3220|nr:hypothetical protein [Nonomuraea sediminis]